MADRIEICGIKGYGYHGVYPEEQATGQPFEVDITVWTDFREAALKDDLSLTISYVDLARIATEVIEGPRVDLIETLASRIADRVQDLAQVYATEVRVHKPEAPIGVEFRDVSVVARRSYKTSKKEEPRADLPPMDSYKTEAHRTPVGASPYRWRGVLSFGSNIGNSRETIARAVQNLGQHADIRLGQQSSYYATAPWGVEDQDDFINLTLIVETNLEPLDLLHILQAEEAKANRQRIERWGPRTLDIDIIVLYDQKTGQEHRGEYPSRGTGTATTVPADDTISAGTIPTGLMPEDITGSEETSGEGRAELILPHPYATERAFVLIPWQEIEPHAHLAGERLATWIEKIPQEEVEGVIPLLGTQETGMTGTHETDMAGTDGMSRDATGAHETGQDGMSADKEGAHE